MIARIAVPMAPKSTISSKVIGMNDGQAKNGFPPKFMGQARVMIQDWSPKPAAIPVAARIAVM